MKANEFCYWLQGYFEICEAQNMDADKISLKPSGIECIKSHLELVKQVEPEHSNMFVAWLTERLQHTSELNTIELRRFLNSQFQHVIDPSYGQDQKELNKIHSGFRPPLSGDTLIRC